MTATTTPGTFTAILPGATVTYQRNINAVRIALPGKDTTYIVRRGYTLREFSDLCESVRLTLHN